jgi:molybdate transport system substrate-binding protein
MEEARAQAEAQGMLCYWGAHVNIPIAPHSLLLCSRSCDDSRRHGWWVALAAGKDGRLGTIEEAPMRSFAPGSCQTEVKVVSGNGARAAISELAARFARESGYKVTIEFAVNPEVRRRIEEGERFDVAILNPPVLDALIKQGKVAGETRAVLGRSGIGVGAREGAPKPDISTVEAFKRTLLEAKSVAYPAEGASGKYFVGLLERLGIAAEMKEKLRPMPAEYNVEVVGRGEAELVVVVASRISGVRGVQFVGRIPEELQTWIGFTAGVARDSKEPEAARALLRFFTAPAAAQVLKDTGVEPFVE